MIASRKGGSDRTSRRALQPGPRVWQARLRHLAARPPGALERRPGRKRDMVRPLDRKRSGRLLATIWSHRLASLPGLHSARAPRTARPRRGMLSGARSSRARSKSLRRPIPQAPRRSRLGTTSSAMPASPATARAPAPRVMTRRRATPTASRRERASAVSHFPATFRRSTTSPGPSSSSGTGARRLSRRRHAFRSWRPMSSRATSRSWSRGSTRDPR